MTDQNHRWQQWQASPVSQQYLSAEARALGYTVVRVPPSSRTLFLDLLPVLALTADLARPEAPAEAAQVTQQWQTYTRRVTAYLRRLMAGKPATTPTLPEVPTHA